MVCDPVSENRFHVLLKLAPNLGMGLTLLLLCRLLLDILHLTLDVILFPVVSDNALQGLGVLNPLYKTSVSAQGDDCVCSESQVSFSRF